ncbi:HemK2/MTQ2 family protein methyltransferase [Streptomyces sp. A1136]|uniref:HemK2/MTQ2 family protein methyltransferase n=1 Tax=Streptomyces sp. A1136 TaxID=2563102 RepID=UPI00109EAA7F|nr:HemK2/MTQ2 family protein methyltransferase [Streptomyces sp. A1136]THA57532.1 methyltransferase domain-containing protein [Streptomyces sp. A1136]
MSLSLGFPQARHEFARLWTLPGVYAPQEDTCLLAEAVRDEVAPGMDVLDIGAGSGALALYAARRGARVTAVDVSWRAALTVRLNALRMRQPITVRRGSVATAAALGPFDLVVSNPPYVPAPDPGLPTRGPARAWDAGHDGRQIVDRICAGAPGLLKPHGTLLIVHSALCGTETTLEQLTAAGMRPEVADRTRIPFGPVLRSRLPWLRERGLLGPEETTEELVVIRAVAPAAPAPRDAQRPLRRIHQ